MTLICHGVDYFRSQCVRKINPMHIAVYWNTYSKGCWWSQQTVKLMDYSVAPNIAQCQGLGVQLLYYHYLMDPQP